ncbi:MAG: hypothetical protein EOO64_01590 [Massilia sp.]|nr:MAG: hypothetical protein EOO64_01590 [Massilia sp.]
MDSLKDFTDGFKAEIDRRLANPFLASFAIALLLFNYKLFILIVGDGAFNDKINYIDKQLYPTWWCLALHFFAVPLAWALFYTFLWPKIDKRIEVKSIEEQAKKKRAVMTAKQDFPVSEEEVTAIRLQYESDLDTAKQAIKNHGALRQQAENKLSQLLAETKQRTELLAFLYIAEKNGITCQSAREILINSFVTGWHNNLEVARTMPIFRSLDKVWRGIKEREALLELEKIGRFNKADVQHWIAPTGNHVNIEEDTELVLTILLAMGAIESPGLGQFVQASRDPHIVEIERLFDAVLSEP